jgi:hypothetical protein
MVVLAILFMVIAYLLDGFALMLLWNWFMTTTFSGLPALSLVQAIGIGIVIGFLTHQHIPRDKEQQNEMMVYAIIVPVLSIIIGWVVHLFL